MPSSSASSQTHKQKSISSFFAAKVPAPVLKTSSSNATIPSPSAGLENGRDDTYLSQRQAGSASKPSSDFATESESNHDENPRPAKRPRRSPEGDFQDKIVLGINQHDAASPVNKGLKLSDRTSRYLFSTTPSQDNHHTEDDDEETIRVKQRLHDRFKKKLGHPNSLAEIRRMNRVIEVTDPTLEDDELDDDHEDEHAASSSANTKKYLPAKKGSNKLTPMERQFLEIKRKHLETVLVVEVGYKFRFFGEDARIAAKELHIVCIPGKFRFDEHPSEAHLDRFASASIPVHRLHVHVKRLVAAGHKVGVVRQLETAALKAVGDNRNAPFTRQLTNLYTKGTYIDDVESLDTTVTQAEQSHTATGHLLCITERNANGWGTDEKVQVGIVAVQPSTGDIIYDDFEDGFMRSEIETRLLHIAPCEFLIIGELSKTSEKLIHHLSGDKSNVFGDKARVERVEKQKTAAAHAYDRISKFYADKVKTGTTNIDQSSDRILDKVHKLSENVSICLSAMIDHLTEYGLQHVFDLTKNFQSFSARSHMLLNANTLGSLEIYRNQTDLSERGSLFWILDQTQTRFGRRLLRKWVGRPLLDKAKLEDRIGAVEEFKEGENTTPVDKLKSVLGKTKSDLERSLIRIYYSKCTRPELLGMLQSLQRIATEYATVRSPADSIFQSVMINDAISVLPIILEDVVSYLDRINPQAAKDDDKYEFFRDEHQTDQIINHKLGIAAVEEELDAHRKEAAEKLKTKRVEYVTVSAIEFLIEVENIHVKNVPASWAKISGTKKVSRFHTPQVVRMIRERDQHKEALAVACDAAFTVLLADISSKYQAFRNCIQALATLDCLVSLAEVAKRPDYCKPVFNNDIRISVVGGRHPMVEQLLIDAYVPNDIDLATDKTRALLITGPNMGGKSSYVRQVALISIMGQIGSYVPAHTAQLGMLDAVFTRMGAFDNMMSGESTFMVELSETSDILKQATPRSLVILDELGRGTSTHDGVAIAQAVLDHIVRETKSLLLFITHYQSLSSVASGFNGQELRNMHMRFTEADNDEDITFLYELGQGVAHRSYGLNVARLANIPESVIDVARVQSSELEAEVHRSKLSSLCSTLTASFDNTSVGELDVLVNSIEQL